MLSRIPIILAICFFTHQLYSQHLPDLKGKWYAADGSNELKLFVADDFALFDSELWDVDQSSGSTLVLSNQHSKVELSFTKDGEKTILHTRDTSYPLLSSKKADLSLRKVSGRDLELPYFTSDQVLLQGVVISDGELPATVSVIYNHAYSGNQKKFVADVDEHGRFKLIYPLFNPQRVMIRTGNSFISYFASPGTKQGIIINESPNPVSWFEAHQIDFMGDLAIENEEFRVVNPEYMKVRDYTKNDSLQKALDSDEYLDYRLGLMDQHKEFYQNYFDSIPSSAFTKDFSFRDIRVYAASDLMRYIWLHNMGRQEGIEPVSVSDQYIEKVKSLVLNEKGELLTQDYAGLNREHANSMLAQENEIIQRGYIDKLYDFLENEISSDSSRLALEAWYTEAKEKGSLQGIEIKDPHILEIFSNKRDQITDFYYLSSWDYLRGKLVSFGTIQRSSIAAIFLDQAFFAQGKDIPTDVLNQLEELELQPEVLADIYRQKEEFEAMKNSKFVEGIEITAASDNILSELKEKYPGKVIYIDVWATWCGPCIAEFSYLEELKKEELEDVVYVYLCGQSPEKTYEPMVKKYNLIGDNYFLNSEAYQKFDKEVGISGFPTYLVITKEGKLVREGIRRPSSGAALVNQLKEFAARE